MSMDRVLGRRPESVALGGIFVAVAVLMLQPPSNGWSALAVASCAFAAFAFLFDFAVVSRLRERISDVDASSKRSVTEEQRALDFILPRIQIVTAESGSASGPIADPSVPIVSDPGPALKNLPPTSRDPFDLLIEQMVYLQIRLPPGAPRDELAPIINGMIQFRRDRLQETERGI